MTHNNGYEEPPVASRLVEGVRLLVAPVPSARSVSFGVWITAGSRDEPAQNSGLFHFIEHLVFKGTPTADARKLSFAIDELGGNIDAFTTREVTGYTGHVVAERLEAAFDLVADLTLESTFPADEVERERQVILEEIRMAEDNPSDLAHEKIFSSLWGEGALGRPITGTEATVNAMTRDALLAARGEHYRAGRVVVSATGAVTEEAMADLVARRFGRLQGGAMAREVNPPPKAPSVIVVRKPIEQIHLALAWPGLAIGDPAKDDLTILNQTLGGGVSSRLFQSVREERGLAYSVGSFFEEYADAGFFSLYAACSPGRFGQLVDAMTDEVKKVVDGGLTEEEVARGIGMEVDNLKMGYDSLSSRMYDLADDWISFGKTFTLAESLADVERVTVARTRALAQRLFATKPSVVAVGPVGKGDERRLESLL